MRVAFTLLILLGCGVRPGLIAAQQQEPSFSVAEADAYVRAVFAESRGGEYGKAALSYGSDTVGRRATGKHYLSALTQY